MNRVDSILPSLSKRALECDDVRQVVPESMKAITEAGLLKVPQPARTGGYEMPQRTQGAIVTALSRACAATGWVYMVMAAHHWCLGTFPEEAQDEVFGSDRDGLVAGTLSWQGDAHPVKGGYRVNGRWQFASGVDHSEWVMLGCSERGSHKPLVHVVIPPNELEIDDTWFTMGLEGSGSKDVVAHDVFVPAHRTIETRHMFGGTSPHAQNHRSNLYKLSAEAMLCMSVSNGILGSAQYGLESFIDRTKTRKTILTGSPKSKHLPTQIRTAEATSEINMADSIQQEVFDAFEKLMASGQRFSIEDRVWAKWQVSYAAELCRRAINRLWGGSGAHAVYSPNALQRAFRNINVGAQHASLDFDSSAEAYGHLLLKAEE